MRADHQTDRDKEYKLAPYGD